MPKNRAIARVVQRPRLRSAVTTIMVFLMTLMILRDIIVRRWGSHPPSASEVTRRLP
jgi:hypothetical protein